MGYCAPALSYVDFRLGGVGISGIKSVWLFSFGFDKERLKQDQRSTAPTRYQLVSQSVSQSVSESVSESDL